MSVWLARVVVRASAWLAPRALRARWREEWLGEIAAAKTDAGRRFSNRSSTENRLPVSVFARALGAPWDALLLRVRGWSGPQLRSGWLPDLRDAFRAICKAPTQTATVLLCLVIGSTLAVIGFGIVNALTSGTLPGIRDRDRLVKLAVASPRSVNRLTSADYAALPSSIPGLAAVGSEVPWSFGVVVDGRPGLVDGRYVSGSYFDMLGTEPVAGRLIRPSDDRAEATPVAVIGHALWNEYFDGRTDAVGRTMQIGGTTFLVVGIAPFGFTGLDGGNLDESVTERAQVFVARAPISCASAIVRSIGSQRRSAW